MTDPAAPVIGENCHLTLTHAAVNNGAPCGFILRAEEPASGAAIAIQRERSSDGTLDVRVFFDVLLAEELLTPAGTPCPWTRAAQYADLLELLSQGEGITLAAEMGVIASLGALGHSATELHYGSHSRVSCQFSCAGAYFPPAPLAVYQASLWDGLRGWGEGYWR